VSHELVETFSNRDGNGYYTDDSNGCEIGDLCEAAATGGIITVPYSVAGRTWQVENYWSNFDARCIAGPSRRWWFAGNTRGFGHGINDGRPFWIGTFKNARISSVLFYYPGDDNWWLGTMGVDRILAWELVSNTAGFGHGINDGRPFWIGDFNGDGRSDVLFYYPGDDNWWLGTLGGNGQLGWSLVSNTAGFGHGINDGRPFWIGRFSRADRDEVLFYYPGDDNWWLAIYDPNRANNDKLAWTRPSKTWSFGHGINDGRPFWVGRFTGANQDQMLFYYPGDDNWWAADFTA
jgi:hypothetical protein